MVTVNQRKLAVRRKRKLAALFALALFLPSSHNEPASTLGAARSPAEAGNDVDEAQLPVEASNEFGVAVIIGNKAYQDDRVAEVLYAHNDADAFHEFVVRSLGFSPDNVVDLRDATKVEMEGAFGAKGMWCGSTTPVSQLLNPAWKTSKGFRPWI